MLNLPTFIDYYLYFSEDYSNKKRATNFFHLRRRTNIKEKCILADRGYLMNRTNVIHK